MFFVLLRKSVLSKGAWNEQSQLVGPFDSSDSAEQYGEAMLDVHGGTCQDYSVYPVVKFTEVTL